MSSPLTITFFMIKTLIATGLITTNIMGAIITNSNQYDISWQKQYTWSTGTDTQTIYTKYGYKQTQVYENPVIKIENKSFIEFYENTTEEVQEITLYIYTKITPKVNITSIDVYYTGQNYINYYTDYNISGNYQLYRSLPNASLNNVFSLTTANATNWSTIDQAWNTETFDFQYQAELLPEGLNYIGNDGIYDFQEGTATIYLLSMLYLENELDEENVPSIPRTEDIFINTPLSTHGSYAWQVDTESANYQVIDVGGLLLQIIAMPMAWLSTAFNFTFWAGTPYAINVGHVLAALIVGGIVIIILKKVYK